MKRKETEYKEGFRDGQLAAYRDTRKIISEFISVLEDKREELYPELYDRRWARQKINVDAGVN